MILLRCREQTLSWTREPLYLFDCGPLEFSAAQNNPLVTVIWSLFQDMFLPRSIGRSLLWRCTSPGASWQPSNVSSRSANERVGRWILSLSLFSSLSRNMMIWWHSVLWIILSYRQAIILECKIHALFYPGPWIIIPNDNIIISLPSQLFFGSEHACQDRQFWGTSTFPIQSSSSSHPASSKSS